MIITVELSISVLIAVGMISIGLFAVGVGFITFGLSTSFGGSISVFWIGGSIAIGFGCGMFGICGGLIVLGVLIILISNW